MSAREVVSEAYYKFLGGSTDVRRDPGREIIHALNVNGYAVVDGERYRVARKAFIDLTEARAELRLDTEEQQRLHDRLVAASRVGAGLLPEVHW